MTTDDIIRMAREAGLGVALTHDGGEPRVWIEGSDWHNELERFAALVAAAEREACAEVCVGTNYYVVENVCECCNRHDEAYHIGKSSYGWAFTFRGYRDKELTSWQAWKEFLKDKHIKDEYGEDIAYAWFVEHVETYKSPNYIRDDGHKNLSHNEQGRIDKYPWFNPEYDWDDPQGYSFGTREFS